MKKYHIISLGCPKNLVDSEVFASIIEENGYLAEKDPENADVIVVNTCGFIKDAKEEAIDTILDMAQYKIDGKCQNLIVTGCLVKRYFNELKANMPEVDHFVNLKDFKTFSKIFYGKYRETRKLLTPSHYAYIRISDGCNNRCSYCAIPDIRGNMKSEPMEKLIKEAEYIASCGVKELIVTAQDTTLYGVDIYKKPMLSQLLKELHKIEGFDWIRLLYLHPAHLKDEMIETIVSLPKVCNYFDMPLQHANDTLLKNMNRRVTQKEITQKINKIRELAPESSIRTTFIVGYPGETQKRFEELKDFIIKTRFDKLGVFTYSKEEGTPAFDIKNRVAKKTAQNRKDELMAIQQKISTELLEDKIGKEMVVIVDGYNDEEKFYECRSVFDAPEIDGKVFVDSQNLKTGDIIKVKIIDSWEYDLVGDII